LAILPAPGNDTPTCLTCDPFRQELRASILGLVPRLGYGRERPGRSFCLARTREGGPTLLNAEAYEELALAVRVPSPVQLLADDRLRAAGVEAWLKREDLIHPEVPGNKWRKLKYNLAEAAKRGDRRLLTFGGAYSNHIRAVAAAGRYCGLSTIGIIRGTASSTAPSPLRCPLPQRHRRGSLRARP
jgi:hypothetical protein